MQSEKSAEGTSRIGVRLGVRLGGLRERRELPEQGPGGAPATGEFFAYTDQI